MAPFVSKIESSLFNFSYSETQMEAHKPNNTKQSAMQDVADRMERNTFPIIDEFLQCVYSRQRNHLALSQLGNRHTPWLLKQPGMTDHAASIITLCFD